VTHWAQLEQGRLRVSRRRVQRSAPGGGASAARAAARAAPARGKTLIELRRATVWRSGRLALRRLTLQISDADCWVVHGANGSGKSTLLATLHGDLGVASAGSIWRRFHRSGMALSEYQDHVGWVCPELQAALPRHLTALQCTVAGLRGAYDLDDPATRSEQRAALCALSAVGSRRLANRRMGELSYGQARRVLFARAMVREPDMVLLDEPYTGLDGRTRSQLRWLVEAWIGQGRTILMATHHRDDWPRGTTFELELSGGVARYCGPVRHSPLAPLGLGP
jgi:ABC-type molybdenum transport system ATPase subunit/photorepair protein PhrA